MIKRGIYSLRVLLCEISLERFISDGKFGIIRDSVGDLIGGALRGAPTNRSVSENGPGLCGAGPRQRRKPL